MYNRIKFIDGKWGEMLIIWKWKQIKIEPYEFLLIEV